MAMMWVNDVSAEDVGFRLRTPHRWADGPAMQVDTLMVPDLTGAFVTRAYGGGPKELELRGFVEPRHWGDVLTLFRGWLQLRFADRPDQVIEGVLTEPSVQLLEEVWWAKPTFPFAVTLRVLCPSPLRADRYPVLVGFDGASGRVPVWPAGVAGDRPTAGETIIGPCTNPVMTLRRGNGDVRAQLAYDGTIDVDEYLRIDHSLKRAYLVDPAGETRALADLTGSFFVFDPADGAVTIELSTGSGLLIMRRRYV